MQFATQREVLEYLGKNPDDRNLIQRLRKKGELYKEDWMYHLITNKQSLIEENRELKLRVQELERASHMDEFERKEMVKLMKENMEFKKRQKEEEINSEYEQRKYEELLADRRFRLEKAFQWIKVHVKWANWDEFYEWVMSDEE